VIQLTFNMVLAAGYLLGVVLIWIGIEMYTVDGARLAPALLSVAVGIGLWWALATVGRWMRRGVLPGVGCENEGQP
jgi:hypothetical protein